MSAPNVKLHVSMKRKIEIKVAERYLPNEVIYRSKTGFGAPIRTWILNDMSALIEKYLNKKSVVERSIFDYEKIKHLIEENRKGVVDASYTIWSLLAIESWMRQFYDKKK